VATLLAILLSLPIVFLALVPSGSVAPALYDAVNAVSALFPFKPALRALDGAINGGALLVPLIHLAGLALVYGAIGRIALRRFT
jgi:ABC-2 type transport system permease protein